MTMKKLYPCLLFLLGLFQTAHAQYSVEQQRPNGWHFGLNGGWSYQSSDVRINNGGFGLGATLGKTIYREPGAPLAFDLRGRLLYARQYGLDNLRSYNIADNEALNGNVDLNYLNYPAALDEPRGFVYANHQTDILEAGLEGVLTLNQLRERTGFIASLYGGIGLDWYRARTDQADPNGNEYFTEYAAIDENDSRSSIRRDLRTALDGEYETFADDFNRFGKTAFMPSLGLEFGYQVSPRLALLAGHRVTFSGTDLLDGQRWDEPDNDLYHYTSLGLQWNIDPARPRAVAGPEIEIIRPGQLPYTSGSSNAYLVANIRRVNSAADISCRLNGREIPFNYRDGQLSTDLPLRPGRNEVRITASNAGGIRNREALFFYERGGDVINPPPPPPPVRREPVVRLYNPSAYSTVVNNDRFRLEATIENVSRREDIEVLQEGRSRDFQFDSRTGRAVAEVRLYDGENRFLVRARNEAGSDSEEALIILEYNRALPLVYITEPAASRSETPGNRVLIKANVKHVTNRDDIDPQVNGRSIRDFDFDARRESLQFYADLKSGANTVVVTARNRAGEGRDEVTIVRRENQPLPRVEIVEPARDLTADRPSQRVIAQVENIDQKEQVEVRVNSRLVSDFGFSVLNQRITVNAQLEDGNNTIRIIVRNDGGSDEDQITIRYQQSVQAPAVSISRPADNAEVRENRIAFLAQTRYIERSSQVELFLNGRRTDFNFNAGRNEVSATLSLEDIDNTIRIVVRNDDGSDEDQVRVRYQPAQAPAVSISRPSDNTMVQDNRIAFLAQTRHIERSSQIELFLNGRSTNFDFNAARNEVSATLTLENGDNTIRITVRNDDGSDEDQVSLRYQQPAQAPTVAISRPSDNTEVKDNRISFLAQTRHIGSSSQVELFLNGRRTNFDFNAARNEVSATLTLADGNNTIRIAVRNDDGLDEDQVSLRYQQPAQAPTVSISRPSDNTVVKDNRIAFLAQTRHIERSSQIELLLNGRRTNFDFNAGRDEVSATLTLADGDNTIRITVRNDGGSDEDQVSLRYRLPQPPTVKIISPVNLRVTDKEQLSLVASVTGVSNLKELTLLQNGKTVTGLKLNKQQATAVLKLAAGENTIVLRARNQDGSAEGELNVTYRPQPNPEVSFLEPVKPGVTSKTDQATIKALVKNVSDKASVTLEINGKTTTDFRFDDKAGTLEANVSLQGGRNTIKVTARNDAGTAEAETDISYRQPKQYPPLITIESVSQPVVDPMNPTEPKSTVVAMIKNMNNREGISFFVNGISVNNFNFNPKTGAFQCTFALQRGKNKIILRASNRYGTDEANQVLDL